MSDNGMPTSTRRTFLKAAVALSAAVSLSRAAPAGLFNKVTPEAARAASEETVLASCYKIGPFFAHVKNGVWYKSTPIKPNLPVGPNAFDLRNRTYSPDRIQYPMKRVGWSPGGKSSNSNRGKGEFVRITWQEALDSTASEIKRVLATYGPSAFLAGYSGHGWSGNYQSGESWGKYFFKLLGGYTEPRVGGLSSVGWADGAPMSIQATSFPLTSYTDILANCKLALFWSLDPLRTDAYSPGAESSVFRWKLKEAGIKFMFIEPWLNDTNAVYGGKYIPVIPGTDEALGAAIAYVWITENLYDKNYVATHTVGFDDSNMPAGAPPNSSFKAYVLGTADGIPKTPQWAQAISGVDSRTIVALAREWASKPTMLVCNLGGANRRSNAGQWVRMVITLQAMLGYIGKPGCAIGAEPSFPRPNTMTSPASAAPLINNPVHQVIHHIELPDAISNPPIVPWTVAGNGRNPYGGGPADSPPAPYPPPTWMYFPMPGYSAPKMMLNVGGSVGTQIPGVDRLWKALQGPNLEFNVCAAAWWESGPMYSDIVMPVCWIGERPDIMSWRNYTVMQNKLIEPLYESDTDLNILTQLATRVGLTAFTTLVNSMTADQWIASLFAKSNVPLTYAQFKAAGYYEYPMLTLADQAPVVSMQTFRDDPVKNPLATPSGKIEIYSQYIANFFGVTKNTQDGSVAPWAPRVPQYVEPMEWKNSALAAKYPLYIMTPHGKFAEHSQYHNMSWQRDEDQMYINGYHALRINTIDAQQRGIQYGDIVRVFNDRGQILCAAKVTERVEPGVVWVFEGGQYKSVQPGTPGALDSGGAGNVLLPPVQCDPLTAGIQASCLVQVEKWGGS